jgi:hypothetical protein
MLEAVKGEFCSLEGVGGAGDAESDALCAALYAGGREG